MKKTADRYVKNTAQKTIPFRDIYENGLIITDKNTTSFAERLRGIKRTGKSADNERYALCFRMSNTNYQALRDSDKEKKLKVYRAILDGLSPDIHYQEFYMNIPVDIEKIKQMIVPRDIAPDDKFGKEYQKQQQRFADEIEQDISDKAMYIILSYVKKSKLDNPQNILLNAFSNIQEKLTAMGVEARPVLAEELFRLLHDIYNPYDENGFMLPPNPYRKGLNIRDYIAPSVFNFKTNYTVMGSCYNKVLFVRGYAETLEDDFIPYILDNRYKIMVAKHIDHINKAVATQLINNRMKSLEEDRQSRNKRNAKEGTNYVPYYLQRQIQACSEILDDINSGQELYDLGLYISISAETLEELNEISKIIIGRCEEKLVNVTAASMRQEEALAAVLPFGNDQLKITSYLLSDGAAIMVPFSYSNFFDAGGFLYGRNTKTRAPLIINRAEDKNGNGFIVGKPGGGKSMAAKMELNDEYYLTKDFLIAIDPEREFAELCDQLKGQRIVLSAATNNFINPFGILKERIEADEEEEESIIDEKISLITSIFRVFKGTPLTAKERTIIDRCCLQAYKPFVTSGYDENLIPTFAEYYEILKKQSEPESKDLALALELYVLGSVHCFSHQTSVDLNNRLVVFDCKNLSPNIKQVGMLVCMDFINQIIIRNREKGYRSRIKVDEFHLFYDGIDDDGDAGTGTLFQGLFARGRKYGCIITGITQNVTGVLGSKTGLSMLQNSQFIMLFEQHSTNAQALADTYHLSDDQAAMLSSTRKGEGLLINKNMVVPFEKIYPQGNLVYDTITTDFDEVTRLRKKNETQTNIV